MKALWSSNHPADLWQCQVGLSRDQWHAAIRAALPELGLPMPGDDVEELLALVLGEGQFGAGHWQFGPAKRLYYVLKPLLPRGLTRLMRNLYNPFVRRSFPLSWPVEPRYARFQWAIMRGLLAQTGRSALPFTHFWPDGRRFAFVLTHDIETADGQAHVRTVADIDESFGFRSCFNFVPERYPLDRDLMDELRRRGFEIGVHGLKHDGRLFRSYAEFTRRAGRINAYLKDFEAVGFRSPLTHRNPEWMQALDIEYDLSFFDTDPCEPCPGGVMSIWPFFIGRFVELPYTLVQDSTLTLLLGETTPRVWLEKLDFIERYAGMALALTHPDYLISATTRRIYVEFLSAMREKQNYWHALPRDVARWWRLRAGLADGGVDGVTPVRAHFNEHDLVCEPLPGRAGSDLEEVGAGPLREPAGIADPADS